jgi:hypothetical protein
MTPPLALPTSISLAWKGLPSTDNVLGTFISYKKKFYKIGRVYCKYRHKINRPEVVYSQKKLFKNDFS